MLTSSRWPANMNSSTKEDAENTDEEMESLLMTFIEKF